MTAKLRVGLTPDLLTSAGTPSFGLAPLELLDRCNAIEWEYLPANAAEISPDMAAAYDVLYVNAPKVTAATVGRADCRVKMIARHGVGFDSVDVAALTRAGIVLTNTPIAIRRPVATMAMTFVLALSQRLFAKDKLTRTGGWNRRNDFMGQGLTTRTIGLVGFGGIGRETVPLARAFDLTVLTADPFAVAADVASTGATLVALDELLQRSDFVVVSCLLNDSTRHLINAQRLAQMKKTAYLINVARGPIVDETALIAALRSGTIAGAALDVFEQEPVAPDNPLLTMDNVIVTPHSLCWTDECFDAIARAGLGSVADFAMHKTPVSVVNREVLDHAKVAAWLANGKAAAVRP